MFYCVVVQENSPDEFGMRRIKRKEKKPIYQYKTTDVHTTVCAY